jgi:hypothetical protein
MHFCTSKELLPTIHSSRNFDFLASPYVSFIL